ncbi:MAG: hypothetical protein Q9196_000631 [Gyalolechia fulgens]
MSGSDADDNSLAEMDAKPPVHPVPQMQGAFEESMMETLNESDGPEPGHDIAAADSVSRRKMLLEQDEYQRTVAGWWKQKPGEQFHPLWKLVAQISFGMHLLQQGLAKSDEEVIKILQTHVDEIDGFLERTTEDIDLAQGDIDERIRYLKLPLEHGPVFDTMLSERNFRIAIVEGNEKIEHIIDRTAAAMNDALKDVQKGLDATRELAKYLTRVDKQWDHRSEEHDSVYLAMIGNTEGWTRAFLSLQSKGNTLRRALVQLGGIVAEMQRRAGAASRKNLVREEPACLSPPRLMQRKVPVRSVQGSRYVIEAQARSPNHSTTPPQSPLKPLPNAPNGSTRSSSQQHSQHSSWSHSGQQEPKQQSKHATPKPHGPSRDVDPSSPRLDRAMSAKRVEAMLGDTVPEPTKSPRNSESPIPAKFRGPSTPREPLPVYSQPQSPASVVTTPTAGFASNDSRSPVQSQGPIVVVEPSEPSLPTKSTDPIIPAREVGTTPPPVPARSASRKHSFTAFTERARFHLTRKKSPPQELDENDNLSTTLPIQSPPSRDSPEKSPSSPVAERLSTGRANMISFSTYSTSPTSTARPSDSPLSRNASPAQQFEAGVPRLSHRSYNSMSFLPRHPQLSPRQDYSTSAEEAAPEPSNRPHRSASVNSGTMAQRASIIEQQAQNRRSPSVRSSVRGKNFETVALGPIIDRSSSVSKNRPKRSSSINIANPTPTLDDVGGRVNLQHPLLREARHAKFAITSEPSIPARGVSRDLPLRHFFSQDNFHSVGFSARPKEIMLPTRTSSLLYNPSAHPALSSRPLHDDNQLSPAPATFSATRTPLYAQPRADPAARSYSHPGTIQSTQATATRQGTDDSKDATPPPISRGIRSPTPTMTRLDINLNTEATSPTTSQLATDTPKLQTSATNNSPFYLNPVSSSALVDFFPRRSNTDPKAFDTQNPYKNYSVEEGKSPVPSGPGGMPMLPLNLSQASPRNKPGTETTPESKKPGWRKMFGAKGEKMPSLRSKSAPTTNPDSVPESKPKRTKAPGTKKGKDKDATAKKPSIEHSIFKMTGMNFSKANVKIGEETGQLESTPEGRSVNGNGGGQSFMGMGKDGMWISRKNFLRT